MKTVHLCRQRLALGSVEVSKDECQVRCVKINEKWYFIELVAVARRGDQFSRCVDLDPVLSPMRVDQCMSIRFDGSGGSSSSSEPSRSSGEEGAEQTDSVCEARMPTSTSVVPSFAFSASSLGTLRLSALGVGRGSFRGGGFHAFDDEIEIASGHLSELRQERLIITR